MEEAKTRCYGIAFWSPEAQGRVNLIAAYMR